MDGLRIQVLLHRHARFPSLSICSHDVVLRTMGRQGRVLVIWINLMAVSIEVVTKIVVVHVDGIFDWFVIITSNICIGIWGNWGGSVSVEILT